MQVLTTLHLTYESLNTTDERWFDVGIIFALIGALKFNLFGALYMLVSASAAPKGAAATSAARGAAPASSASPSSSSSSASASASSAASSC